MQAALKRLGIDMSVSELSSKGMTLKDLKGYYLKQARRWHPDGKPAKDKAHFEKVIDMSVSGVCVMPCL